MPNKKRDDSHNGEMVHVRDDIYKIPYRRSNGDPANYYYVKTCCFICSKEFYRCKSNHVKGGRPICSKKCSTVFRSKPDGEKKYRLCGKVANDHILIKNVSHPNAKKGWIYEHRSVMEESIGRYLTDNEHVHHINMLKNDNRIENLLLCNGTSIHHSVHGSLNSCVAQLIENGSLIFDKAKKEYIVISQSNE